MTDQVAAETPPVGAAASGTPPVAAAPVAAATQRHPDLVIAHVHLRLGSLGIARAELETLAGRDLLDDDGIRDLAEARWRTGDGPGAGEAAAAYLESRPDDVLALVIAAEAQADLGRPGEARRLAGIALEHAAGSLDPIFAGMPRSSIWPVDAGAAGMSAGVLFDELQPGPLPTARRRPDPARRSTRLGCGRDARVRCDRRVRRLADNRLAAGRRRHRQLDGAARDGVFVRGGRPPRALPRAAAHVLSGFS